MKKLTAMLLAVVLALTACGDNSATEAMVTNAPSEPSENIGKITVTDMLDREIILDEPAKRVVVLTAADCEILYAIGAGDSFNSGFVSAFVAGHPLEDCQRNGNLTGAVNTTAAGGTGAFTSREAVAKTAEERFNVTLL